MNQRSREYRVQQMQDSITPHRSLLGAQEIRAPFRHQDRERIGHY